MELNDYQRESRKTALYPEVGSNAIYPTLGLVGEAGEVADKVKKIITYHHGFDEFHTTHSYNECSGSSNSRDDFTSNHLDFVPAAFSNLVVPGSKV